jgi:hypothetical protein
VAYTPVNVKALVKLPAGSEVTPESLRASGVVRSLRRPVKILGDGEVADLVAMLLLSRLGTDSKIRRSLDESVSSDEVALDCRLGRNGGPVGISVLEKLLDPTHHWLEEDAPRPLAVHS